MLEYHAPSPVFCATAREPLEPSIFGGDPTGGHPIATTESAVGSTTAPTLGEPTSATGNDGTFDQLVPESVDRSNPAGVQQLPLGSIAT
jgi:hypothetical protein